ncbi:MAG: hypothetical protein DRO88_05630 [Promethearchaeia archaeon]|nr:MAG: hypothetical protein DRO88_05630 [Candidatus Lokiarchaeia archaeon]
MNSEEKYQFAVGKFAEFHNYLEIEDFRKFLLLILNLDAGGPEAMMQQLGMGAKRKVILPYDPEKHFYYTKVMSGLSYHNQMMIYHKSKKLSDEFLNEATSPLFTKFLSTYERKNLLPGNFKILTPEVADYTQSILQGKNASKPIVTGVESLFFDLAEMIVSQQAKFLFLMEDPTADILFSMNISFNPNMDADHIQMVDVFVDEEHKYRDHTFIRMKEGTMEMDLLDEITELSHGDLYKSHFTILVPIKSLNAP